MSYLIRKHLKSVMYSVGWIYDCLAWFYRSNNVEVYVVVALLDRFAARRPDVFLMVQTGCLLRLLATAVYWVLLNWTLLTVATWHRSPDCDTAGVKHRSSTYTLLCIAKKITCRHLHLSSCIKLHKCIRSIFYTGLDKLVITHSIHVMICSFVHRWQKYKNY